MTAEPRNIYVMQFELALAKETVADLEAEIAAAVAEINNAAAARVRAYELAAARAETRKLAAATSGA